MSSWSHALLFAVLASLLLTPLTAFAQDNCAPWSSTHATWRNWSDVRLDARAEDGGSVDNHVLSEAMNMWNNCDGVPTFSSTNSSADFTVEVVFHGNSSIYHSGCDTCACIGRSYAGDTLTGATVHLFETTSSGQECDSGRSQSLAHEMGHFLGLGEAATSGCDGRIMSGYDPSKTVSQGDCESPDDLWAVEGEADDFDHQCTQPPAT